jgi:hypothetical protein
MIYSLVLGGVDDRMCFFFSLVLGLGLECIDASASLYSSVFFLWTLA